MKTKKIHKGPTPFGFQKENNGTLIPNKHQQMIIDVMQNLRSQGFSFKEIAEFLNSLFIPSPKNQCWTADVVNHIIKRGESL